MPARTCQRARQIIPQVSLMSRFISNVILIAFVVCQVSNPFGYSAVHHSGEQRAVDEPQSVAMQRATEGRANANPVSPASSQSGSTADVQINHAIAAMARRSGIVWAVGLFGRSDVGNLSKLGCARHHAGSLSGHLHDCYKLHHSTQMPLPSFPVAHAWRLPTELRRRSKATLLLRCRRFSAMP